MSGKIKIKDLALQTFESINAITSEGVADRHTFEQPWFQEYSQKLAELIVRECADICEIEGESYKYSFTPSKARLAESTSKHCATMIKNHFGVK